MWCTPTAGTPPGEGHRLGTGSPTSRGADQAGTGGIGDRVDIRRRAAGLVEHLADQRRMRLTWSREASSGTTPP